MNKLQVGIQLTTDGSGKVKAEITDVSNRISAMGRAGQDSANKLKSSLNSIEKATTGLSSAAVAARRALAGVGAALSARELIQTADAYSGIVAKLKLVSGSAQEFAQAQSKLFELSQQNMAPLAETVQLYSRLANSMRDLGRSQADTLAITDLVGKSLRISGADAASSAAGILQFAQAIGSGVLRGDEFNSMMENSPRLAKALADGLNAPVGALREMATQGELTADKVLNAILSQSEAIKREYTTMPVTVSGAFQKIENAFTSYIGQTDQANQSSRKFAEALSSIADNMDMLMYIPSKVAEGFSGLLLVIGKVGDAIHAIKQSLSSISASDALQWLIAPDIKAWSVIDKGQSQQQNPSQYTTGGGFGGEDTSKPFFDGVKRGANDAALAMAKLTEKQKAVAQIVIDTAKAYKVDPAFALAIAQQESGFNQLAKSAVGARGVMQLMPGTAKQLGVNFNDLNDNIKGGVMYLAQQEKQFKSLRLAAAAYNSGPGNVQKYGGVPPFKETQNYVVSVGALYEKWKKVLGVQGESFVTAQDQANETAKAYDRIKTRLDDSVKQAEENSKVQVEQAKTRLAALDQERKAAADLAAEQLAGAKTYDEKAKIIEAAQRTAADYNAKALDLVRAEYDAQQKVMEVKKAAIASEIAQADKYNVSIDDQFKLKQALRAVDTDLALLAQNRAQAEIDATGKVNEFTKQSADLKRGEASAIDGIISAYQRQLDILNRLTAAKEAGASAEQLNLLSDYYQSIDSLPDLVSQDQIARMEQYTLSTKALRGAVDELTGSQKKNQEQLVADEQLRLNQAWDQAAQRMIEYAESYEKAFGKMGKALAGVSKSMAIYSKQVLQIERDKAEAIKKSGSDEAKKQSIEMEGQLETLGATLSMLGNVAGAMRNMYEEGTSGYKAMAVAQQSLQMATQITNIALGIQAILNQGMGDPYSAIPRMIAMAGMVAALIGQAVGMTSGGSSSTASNSESRQESAGSGTVFGDASAKSESISNSLEAIRNNTSNDLNYSAAMLRALEGIESAIKGTTNAALINFRDIANGMADKGAGYATINENKSISDWGIAFDPRTLQAILAQGMSLGTAFVSNNRNNVDYKMPLSPDGPGKEIARTIKGISEALIEGGKAFGLTSSDFKKRLEGFVVDLGIISLKGLNGDDIEKQFSAIMSSLSDQMAEKFMPGLIAFQKVGEGYAETFWRVAEGINRATGELERLGVDAIRYTKIVNAQGDVAAEIIRQSLAAQNTLSDGVREYINVIQGSADDIVEAYKKIMRASSLLKTAQIGDKGLSTVMTNAAGGVDNFVASMEAFNENFLSPAEQYAGNVRDMGDAFARLGITMPTSREGFRDLVSGIDTSTDAGKKLFGALIALAPAFAEIANQAESIREKYAAILDPFKTFADQIKTVGSDFASLLSGATTASTTNLDAIGKSADKARDPLEASRSKLLKQVKNRFGSVEHMDAQINAWQDRLAEELAKPPKKQNKELIKTLQRKISRWTEFSDGLDEINQQLANIDSQEGIDKASEAARLAIEKQAIIDDATNAMAATLEDVFNQIAQTVQAAQQRLQSAVSVQKSLASQLAQLQGPGAVFDLANSDRNAAFGAIDQYIGSIQAGAGRNVETEIGLLNDAQSAVMAKYNAEIAAIQESERVFISAETDRLNAALQLQIDAINATTEAAIAAETDRLDAVVKAQGKLNDAEQKALQKVHDAQMKALSDELDAANRLRDAIKSVAEYARGMALGGNSPLSPEQRLAESQRQYQDLLTRAQGGDAEAMGRLTSASDAYLEAAKQYYGSGTQYSQIFDGIKNGLTAIGGMSAPDPDSIQSRIDALRESQAEEMDALREKQQAQIDAIRETSQKVQEDIRKGAQAQIDALQKATQQAIADLSDPNKNAAMRAAREAAERDMKELQRLAELTRIEAQKQADEAKAKAEEMANAALDLANKQLAELQAGTQLNRDQVAALNRILLNAGLTPIPGYAKGGLAQPGLALVGEQGPELVRFNRPGQVFNANETKSMLGDDEKIVAAIAELKAEMRAVVVTQSNANPQIIDKLTGMEARLSKMERTQRFTVGS